MVKVHLNNETAFDFGIFSNEKKKVEQAYVSIDKQGRVYMNADAQRLFNIEKGKPVDLQLGYKDGVIYAIETTSPHAAEGAKPFRFSGDRAYASAKSLIEHLGITPKGDAKSEKYLYIEEANDFAGVFAFKHEALVAEAEKAAAADNQLTLNEAIDGATTEVAATKEEEPKAPKAPRKKKEEKLA